VAKELSLFDQQQAQLPAHLQGYDSGLSKTLMEAVGQSLNRIGTKGSRFRQIVRGVEEGMWEENYLDVIIIGAVDTVSRRFYEGAYSQGGGNAPPSCYSVDGITPAEDVKVKQSVKCATCPQDIKGSKVSENGTKAKACSYFRRLVVMLAGDPEGIIYRLDVTAMGLFGESYDKQHKYTLNDYSKALMNRHMDAGAVVTRLSFDTDQSVPKLLFQSIRYISEQDVECINAIHQAGELPQYLEVSMKTVDISSESTEDTPPPAASKPVASAKPKATAKPAPKPEPEEEAEEEEEAPPVVQKPVQKVAPKPAPQKPAPAPVQKAAPAPVKVAPPKTAPVVQEVDAPEALDDILAGLDL
jgi:hypothetical protein